MLPSNKMSEPRNPHQRTNAVPLSASTRRASMASLLSRKARMLMTTNLQVNDQFPEIELPNHQNELTRLAHFTKPGLLDRHLGFLDGYPLILVFYRGFFCPREQQQMRQLVEFQHELAVNYGKLAAVSADPPFAPGWGRSGPSCLTKSASSSSNSACLTRRRASTPIALSRTRLCCDQTCASTLSITDGTLSVGPPTRNCGTTCAPSWKAAPITATRRTIRQQCGRFAYPSRSGRMAHRRWEPTA